MKKNVPYYQLSKEDILQKIGSDTKGLTSNEAARRLNENGPNKLPSGVKISPWAILIQQVKSPLVFVLVFAAIISLFIGEVFDVVVILAIVVINTVIGFWQEYKADRSIEQLQSLVKQYTTVLRNGQKLQILSEEVVIGDILLLESGDKVPADARLLEATDFYTNEASLTGESMPIGKSTDALTEDLVIGDRANMVFMGSTVERGRAKALVIATGANTQIGHIADLVQSADDTETPLQIQLKKLSGTLTIFVLVAAFVVLVIGFLRGLPFDQILVTSAALAVSAIPEGLLVAFTLVLVVGMQRILKQKALVRKLIAAETLGSVSIVCSDKTGTITEGIMKVDQLVIGDGRPKAMKGFSVEKAKTDEELQVFALKLMALCNNAYVKNPQDKLKQFEVTGDSTDAALLFAALHAGFNKQDLTQEYKRIDEIPFHETYKFHATLHDASSGGKMLFAKGAPESVLAMCGRYQKGKKTMKLSAADSKRIHSEYEALTKQGLRVLGLAYSKVKKSVVSFDDLIANRDKPKLDELVFLGWVGLKDPVREEVKQAFVTMQKASIRTVIITGDHKYTVQAIIRELGLDVDESRILVGSDLDVLSDKELYDKVEQIDIFARVEPKHKLRIVQAWKSRGEVVAMLGDGVNDAPALKAADIGVAVGESATDVAKETSDMILLEGNFQVIESAIREGRVIFDNIRKIFLYLISDSFTGILLISISLILGFPIPLLVAHILWINIASDGLLNLALTVEPAERDVMLYPPRDKDERIVNKELYVLIATMTAVGVFFVTSLYIYFLRTTGDVAYARTLVFTAFAIDSIIYVFSIKSLRQSIWKINPFSNIWLVAAAILTTVLQVVIVYTPFLQPLLKTVALRPLDWLYVLAVGIAGIIVRETIKWIYWHQKRMT